jgi:hypothetical protein
LFVRATIFKFVVKIARSHGRNLGLDIPTTGFSPHRHHRLQRELASLPRNFTKDRSFLLTKILWADYQLTSARFPNLGPTDAACHRSVDNLNLKAEQFHNFTPKETCRKPLKIGGKAPSRLISFGTSREVVKITNPFYEPGLRGLKAAEHVELRQGPVHWNLETRTANPPASSKPHDL